MCRGILSKGSPKAPTPISGESMTSREQHDRMANAIRFLSMNAAFGNDLVNHHTYVLAGDGCLMEGVSHEAVALAGHLKLNKLIVFWDNNNISIDGPVSLADNTDQVARFQACGWNASHIDGTD